ncbi:MAG: SDR family oxidoreductase [Alphaproteobacteria bacterium]|nr:SDR family oxidoreductase [Alphaproteobacteria bacterium]
MSLLDGKGGIVSGAAQGLGVAFARSLAENGADVLIFDVKDEVMKVAETLSKETGQNVIGMVADVSKRADVEKVVQTALDKLPGIDVLVNNAGTWRDTPVDSPWEQAVEDYDFIMDTNLKGVLMLSRACGPHMKGRGDANIIQVSTYYVLPAKSDGTNQPHTDLYNASKWALNGFTDAWSKHYAEDGIRVNGLCMGAVDSPMLRNLFEGGKLPDELADVVMQPEQMGQLMIDIIAEGPGGRTGENVGAWVGEPVKLPPKKGPLERITGYNKRLDFSKA